jgi:hypothetical protein
MPFLDVKSNQPFRVQSMDRARTECLSEWTALAVALDLDEDLVAASPYRFYASKKNNKRNHYVNMSTSRPCSDPHTRALERMTESFDYLRLRHEPIDTDDESIGSDPFAISRAQVPAKEKQKQMQKKNKKKRKERKEAERDPSFFHDTQKHDMCALFFTSTGHLGECQGDIRVGDGIYILGGAQYPFVLRETSVRKKYTVVGKATINRPYEAREEWDPSKLNDDPGAHQIVLV